MGPVINLCPILRTLYIFGLIKFSVFLPKIFPAVMLPAVLHAITLKRHFPVGKTKNIAPATRRNDFFAWYRTVYW